VPDDEAARTSAEFASYQSQADLHFAAQRRLLAREEPDYAD
jgi:hypothetical protein